MSKGKRDWGKINIQASRGTYIDDTEQQIQCIQISFNGKASIIAFQELLNRALNTWEDAPPEFKALADCIQYGKPLQQYNTQVKINESHLSLAGLPKESSSETLGMQDTLVHAPKENT